MHTTTLNQLIDKASINAGVSRDVLKGVTKTLRQALDANTQVKEIMEHPPADHAQFVEEGQKLLARWAELRLSDSDPDYQRLSDALQSVDKKLEELKQVRGSARLAQQRRRRSSRVVRVVLVPHAAVFPNMAGARLAH